MTQTTLRQTLDGAKLVKYHPELDSVLAVWHGGHTVNFYMHRMVMNSDRSNPRIFLDNFDVANYGSFENDSATLQEVKEGIANYWENNEF